MRPLHVLLAGFATIACLTACIPTAGGPAKSATAGINRSELDPAVRPADDLFTHVNGKWLAANDIPADRVAYGTLDQLVERVEEQVHAVVKDAVANPSGGGENKQIADIYTAYMDQERIDAAGLSGLQDIFERIDQFKSHDDVWRGFAELGILGVGTPLGLFIETDGDNPDRMLAYVWQSGLGLPDRDYYFSEDAKLVATREAYQKHITTMYELAGWADGKTDARRIIALETTLANAHWTRVQNRDRQRIYRNKFDLLKAWKHSGGLDWRGWFAASGYAQQGEFVLAQDTYFGSLREILLAHDVETWKRYLRFKVLKGFAPYLPAALDQENFAFEGTTLRGQPEQWERWKRAISLLNQIAGEPLGKLYIARHFPESSKARVEALVEALRFAFGESIRNNDWMSELSRREALVKLESFGMKLGYPDVWRDYSKLATSRTDAIGNVRRGLTFDHRDSIEQIGKAPDRSRWGMNPQTVNAYYRPTFNEIVFPAAILQPPFFDPNADDAANYGAIGAVIGHEFSHGFDDQGRKFDGSGKLRDWWQPEDVERYDSRARRLVEQFSAFEPIPGTKINGELTLGENIADIAGVTMAYRAYVHSLKGKSAPVLDGLSGEQRFFLAFAQVWRGKTREAAERERLLTDPHSPPRYRVLGVLRNVPEFHQVFGVREGDGMWLPPEEQVRLW